MTCADAYFTDAASKLTRAALISSVRKEFYHLIFSKCNMYVRIINVQTGNHIPSAELELNHLITRRKNSHHKMQGKEHFHGNRRILEA